MAEASMVREFRKPRRYAPSGSLERFLRAKYLEQQSGAPMFLMPAAGAALVYPQTSNTRTAPSGRARASGQTGTLRAVRTATKQVARAVTLALFGAIAYVGQAHADQVVSTTGVFIGDGAAQYSVSASGPGSLTVDLINYGWPSPLADLTVEITSATKVLGEITGAGQETLALTAPGTYYAYVSGNATGPLNIGTYGLTLDCQTTPVPLPASISLLLGGVAAMLWQTRRKIRTDNDLVLVPASA